MNQEIDFLPRRDDERDPLLLACNKVFDAAFKGFNSPANVAIHYRKYSNEATQPLVSWEAEHLW